MKNPFEKFLKGKPKEDEKERQKKEAMEYLRSLTPAKGWEILNTAAAQRPLNSVAENWPEPEKFDQARVEKVFPSKELQRAFDLTWARMHGGIEGINNKKKAILEINERRLIDPKVLSRGPAVYLGSGTDIEFPLLVGARNITMVDYGYESVEIYIEDLKRRLKIILEDKQIKAEGNKVSFDLDVGGGKIETVSIVFEPKQIVGGPFPLEKDRFVPEQEMSLLMSYAPTGIIDIDPSLMQKVCSRGYVLSDSSLIGDEKMKERGFIRTKFEAPELDEMRLFQKE